MPSAEYDEILSAIQRIVSNAYALGRSEALKQVVDVLKADPAPTKPLALAAPVDPPVQPAEAPVAQPQPEPQPPTRSPDPLAAGPWWSRPLRK